jgi:hypothetical protein
MDEIKLSQIALNNENYYLCKNVFDLYDVRFVLFKQYLLQSIEGMDFPLFEAAYQKAIAHINKGDFYSAQIEYDNYRKAVQLQKMQEDATTMCFAIICLEKGENQRDIDANFFKSKIERMRKNGLTRGLVEESVVNFIIASPSSFGEYSAMLETITKISKVIQSNE